MNKFLKLSDKFVKKYIFHCVLSQMVKELPLTVYGNTFF